MSLKTALIGGTAVALIALIAPATSALAQSDTYICNDQTCYDDQADETRRLNLEQLENGGTVITQDDYDDDADMQDDMQGQGGPFYENEDEANQSMGDDDAYGDDSAPYDDDGYADDDDDAPPPPADYDDDEY